MAAGNSGASFASTAKTKIRSTATSAPVIVQHPEEKSESAAQMYARTVRTQWQSADLTDSCPIPRAIPLRGSVSADLMRLSSLPEISQETPRSSSVHLPERKHRTHRKSTKLPKERKRSCSPPRRHVYTSFPIQQHLYSLYPQLDDGGSEEEGRGICREPCCASSLYGKNHSSSKLDVETVSSSTLKSKELTRRKRSHHHHSKPHLESTNLDGLVQSLERMNIHERSYPPLPYSPGSVRDTGCSCSCDEEVQEVEVISFAVTVAPPGVLTHRDAQRPLSYASSI